MNAGKAALIFVILVATTIVWDGFFILPEGQQAIVTQLGAPVGNAVVDAGPHLKLPIIQKVRYLEKRILIWDGKPNQVPTRDKTFIFLDTTARWKITDALLFMQSVRDYAGAQAALDDIIDSAVRDLVNQNNLVEIIRSSDWDESTVGDDEDGKGSVKLGRDKISDMIFENAGKITPKYGIELVDVMFKRVNYIESVRLRVYDRMISERQRIAAEKRSMGEGEKAEILGKLDRELKTIISEAERKANEIKGAADAKAARIYADAYSKDPEFYAFTESLKSYEKTVKSNTKLLISSDHEYYKYMDKK
jgi:membrane protease subunit HflC